MRERGGTPLPATLWPQPAHCREWGEAEVHHRLTANPAAYLAFAEAYLGELGADRTRIELPPKQVFTEPAGGDFRLMPCVVRGPRGVLKTVKVIGTNRVQIRVPGQITVGELLVLDSAEHFVSHRFAGCLLSSARTGVTAALALKYLAAQARRVTVIGAGRVGYYVALYCAHALPLARIDIVDQDPMRAEATARALASCGVPCQAAETADADSDAWLLATTSTEPFCAPPPLGPALAVSLGADALDQHELCDAWADRARLWVDSVDALAYGDLHSWRRQGLIADTPPPDLLTLLASAPPAGPSLRLFVSTGCALLDNMTAAYLLATDH
ncbi:hypothetical protein [Immundisolibacter sp.]|uniref:hypothetical protein n=1 Tax=Immundisolibacter sp. TaxID=1934948 RepID=UPI003561DD56